MACRFPGGSRTPADFWTLLDRGIDAVTEIPPDRWNIDAFYDADPAAAGKMATRCGAFIDGVGEFDPQFFGISPREAQTMDPQQRVLLEVTWEALENANIPPSRLYGSATGVYIGITCFDHAIRLSHSTECSNSYSGTGSALNMAPGRISYVLGLTGPSMAVDTACSSALVCLHLACQSLRQRESDMAIAGGVHLMLSPDVMVSFSQARMLAPDGRSKTFDASANGYSRGEGCGVVILKRLSDAVANGDTVLGLIRGTAVNQDGPSGGLTVPNGASQRKVIHRALANAGIRPGEVAYVEAHGTGTSLGDPIEVEALAEVYGQERGRSNPLRIGSVKTNIGHLEPAAGMAGLIKILLAFQNERVPRHLHFDNPNPHIPWSDLPVMVVDRPFEWPRAERRRIAAVSAFGFSGTNAHAVIEEPAQAAAGVVDTDAGESPLHLLVMSAKTEEALKELSLRYHAFLSGCSDSDFASVCRTAGTGRDHFAHRLALIARVVKDAREALEAFAANQSCPDLFHGKISVREQLGETEIRLESTNSRESMEKVARLYISGASIDWTPAVDGAGRSITKSLPNYPFQRRRYWVETTAGAPSAPSAGFRQWLYHIDWERQNALKLPADLNNGRRWLIVPGDQGLASGMQRVLSEYGLPSVTASIDDAAKAQATDVVYLCPVAVSPYETNQSWRPLLDLVHRLVADRGSAPLIWIITRGAMPAGLPPTAEGLVQAPVAGFARVLSLEHPELFGRFIDLDPNGSGDRAEALALVAEIAGESAEHQVALRQDGRYVPRLDKHDPNIDLQIAAVRPESTYLITGGLGVLGLHVARWLAGRGARHLCLLGRSGIVSGTQSRAVAELRSSGVDVAVFAVDVADGNSMASVFQDLNRRMPELRGIVHAAGLPGYVDIEKLTADEMEAILRPKIQGAWRLHELTRETELDFFVCFSSIASAWGSRGQAHYAAANGFLDALAHYRRALGLPAVSINWGPWLGGGMSSGEAETLLRRVGVNPLSPETAIQALEHVACSGVTQPVVADVDWNLFKGSYEARGHRPLLERLKATSSAPVDGSKETAFSQQMKAIHAQDREAALIAILQLEVLQVLALDSASKPDPEQGLFEMGMDSLMALELRTRLERRMSHALPATLALDCPNIRSMARFLIEEVLRLDTAAISAAAAAVAFQNRGLQAELQIDVESLSEEDAEELLLKRLATLDREC
jgi:acyl transferase domain-containing protein